MSCDVIKAKKKKKMYNRNKENKKGRKKNCNEWNVRKKKNAVNKRIKQMKKIED